MKSPLRSLSALAALALGGVAAAQSGTYASVAAQGGSVAGRVVGGAYQSMPGVAGGSTIDLNNGASVDDSESGEPPSFQSFSKFSGPTNAPSSASYSNGQTNDQGTTSTQGSSMVTNSATAPTYYTAGWGTTASPNANSTYNDASGGTYDPWNVTYDSVLALGAKPGDTVELYYQSTLFAANPTYGVTALGTAGGGSASYSFSSYALDQNGAPFSLGINFDTRSGLNASLDETGDFTTYLLGANAEDPNASPTARLAAGTLLSAGDLTSTLASSFLANGTPTHDLSFGVVRRFVVAAPSPTSALPFEWHTDTYALAQSVPAAVPEPSALAALGLGAAAFLRKRRRRAPRA